MKIRDDGWIEDNNGDVIMPWDAKPLIMRALDRYFGASGGEVPGQNLTGGYVHEKKAGHVYLMHSMLTRMYKIGISRDVEARRLSLQRSVGHPIELIACQLFDDPYATEKAMHAKYGHCRSQHGEWFCFSDKDVEDIVAFLSVREGVS